MAAYRRTPARRGRDRHTGFRIATRFPFGLFEKSREVEAEGELIIYPAVDPVRLPRRTRGAARAGRRRTGAARATRPTPSGPCATGTIRATSTGARAPSATSSSSASARGRRAPTSLLCVDTVRPTAASRQPESEAFAAQFERRVREVASRAVAHIKRGDGVMVSTTLGERVRGDKNLGADPILRFLALLDWIDEARVETLRPARGARAVRAGLPGKPREGDEAEWAE